MTARVRSEHQSAKSFCVEHREEFERELVGQALSLILGKYWIFLILSSLAAAANFPYIGFEAVWLMLPGACSIFIPTVANFFAPRLVARIGAHWVSLVLLANVVCLAGTWGRALGQNISSHDNPVQMTLMVVCAFSFQASGFAIVMWNTLLALAMGVSLAIHRPDFVVESGGQFIAGLGAGTWLAFLVLGYQRMRFFAISIQRSLNTHLLDQLSLMVYPHQRSMIEVYHSLTDTMPTFGGEAVIGEFDILESSPIEKLDPDRYHTIKDRIFQRSYDRILQSYILNPVSPETPFCDAHVVKELGDGYIFSVGFPFPLPSNEAAPDVALKLCIDMIQIFESMSHEFPGQPSKVRCAIAITQTFATGFWNKYRVKHYDFRQGAIVPVARLQELRRVLLKRGLVPQDKNFIIMTDKVFFSLSSPNNAQEIRLSDHDLQLRGAPEVESVYICALRDQVKIGIDDISAA